jgi:2-polyprenyl-6-methoxyphenol hydroxylase-like FAD-dependent oxidoreductase
MSSNLNEHRRVVIVGAGFAGIEVARGLGAAGVSRRAVRLRADDLPKVSPPEYVWSSTSMASGNAQKQRLLRYLVAVASGPSLPARRLPLTKKSPLHIH